MITTLENAMLIFMKKLSKEQSDKRNKLKQYLLRSLHIVSYVLSALFIIVCIVVGVQSCKGKNNKSSQKVNRSDLNGLVQASLIDNFVYSYVSKLNDGELSLNFQNDFSNALGGQSIDFNNLYSSNPGDVFKVVNLNDVYIYNNDNEEFSLVERFYVCFSGFAVQGNNGYRYRLSYINFSTNGSWLTYVEKVNGYANDLNYRFNDFSSNYLLNFYTSLIDNNNAVFEYFFNKTLIADAKVITMPNILNYYYWITDFSYSRTINASIAQSIDVAKSNQFDNSLQSIYVYIDMPYFVSNGKLYNRIALNYLCLGYGDSARYFQNTSKDSGYDEFLNSELDNYGLFKGMAFMNTDVSSSIVDADVVLLRSSIYLPKYPYSSGQLVEVYTKDFAWQMPAYQNIRLLEDFTDENALTSFELLISSSINNATVNPYSSVFSLLSYAFASLKGIFDIQVMPMLSIGVLLFTPLLIGLIVVIFRMVKK